LLFTFFIRLLPSIRPTLPSPNSWFSQGYSGSGFSFSCFGGLLRIFAKAPLPEQPIGVSKGAFPIPSYPLTKRFATAFCLRLLRAQAAASIRPNSPSLISRFSRGYSGSSLRWRIFANFHSPPFHSGLCFYMSGRCPFLHTRRFGTSTKSHRDDL
jgi:hypothetical protein